MATLTSQVCHLVTAFLIFDAVLKTWNEQIIKRCAWQQDVNVVNEGSINEFMVGSLVECVAACLFNPQCVSSRFQEGNINKCMLRNESGSLPSIERKKEMGKLYLKPQEIEKANKPTGFAKVGAELLRISTQAAAYSAAEASCAAYKGAIILTPSNPQLESTFRKILTTYRTTTMIDGIWIGIDKRNSAKEITVSTGHVVTTSSYVKKFFSNSALESVGDLEDSQDCAKLVLEGDSLGIKWENCSKILHYVCQHFGRNFAEGKNTYVRETDTDVSLPAQVSDANVTLSNMCLQTPSEIRIWILLDLSRQYIVHAIRIANCVSYSSETGFEIRVGYNATAVQGNNVCKFYRNKIEPGSLIMLECEPCPLTGQYVTVQNIGSDWNNLGISGLEVYGREIHP